MLSKLIEKLMNRKGQSLVEVLVAMSIFALVASSISFIVIDSYNLEMQSGDISNAQNFAAEGLDAIRSIKENNWLEIVNNSNGLTHGLDDSSNYWEFSGSSNVSDKFTRTISIEDVYRNNNGKGDIVAQSDPNAVLDLHTKEIIVTVNWSEPRNNQIVLTEYMSNWESYDWVQTDWSGGSGQSLWSDETMYSNDDGNIDVSIPGEIQLATTTSIGCEGYTWEFDEPADYTYDSGKIEVLGGNAQLASTLVSDSGNTTDPGFDTGTMWSGHQWDFSGGDYSANNRIAALGNPTWWVYNYLRIRDNREVGGYWEQAFDVTSDNPDSVEIDLDYFLYYNIIQDSYDQGGFYVFVENFSGEPDSLGDAVWSLPVFSSDPTGVWNSISNIDATSKVTTAGTYYLKIGMYLETGNGPGNDNRYLLGGYDNVELSWEKSTSGYPTDHPSINPNDSYQPTTVNYWTSFREVASKDGGEIYYQISDNDGTTWYYWDGSSWVAAGSSDYNTVAEVSANIWRFPTTNSKFNFKAYLESGGSQFVQLDEVIVGCEIPTMEVGVVTTDENWAIVNFANNYNNPVVIASYYEANNSLPASTRIQNLDQDSMEIRLQHPSEANLSSDEITYLVIEEGGGEIGGIKYEAHMYDTNTVGSSWGWNYDTQTYINTFTSDPVVFHQVMTNNDPDWISTYVSRIGSRTNPPNTSGVAIALNGAEVASTHGSETIGWIAIERDLTGIIDIVDVETYRTTDSVQGHGSCYNFNYQNSYSAAPLVLGFIEEMDGNNGGWSVTCNNTATQAGFHVEEDQERDGERNHTGETLSFIAFANAFDITSGSGGGGGGPFSGEFTDDNQVEFDQGTYNDTQYSTDHVELTGTGMTNGPGDYTSLIFDVGQVSGWDTLSWVPSAPYGKQLPANGGSETAYASGNVDMTGNQVLLYMNEFPGATSFTDSSGNGNNASCGGATCPDSGGEGKLDTALSFDGSQDYISSAVDLNQWLGGTASVSYWIKTTQIGGTTFWSSPGITGAESAGDGNDIFWGYIDNTGRIGFHVGDGNEVKSTNPINDDQLHHIFMSRDSTSGLIKLYVDGQFDSQIVSDTGLKTTSFTSIGRIEDTGGTPEYYQGSLDEFVIWDRVLSDSEVLDIYNRGGLNLRLQLRSCDDASCDTETFIGPDGTGSTYYSEVNNTGLDFPSFDLSGITNNQYIQYKVFFNTDSSSNTPELQEVTIVYSGNSGSGYELNGILTSSAYDMGGNSIMQIVSWSENIPSCTPACDVQIQLRSAPDSGGSPGVWTDWYGSSGIGTYFSNFTGELIPSALSGNQWVQYRVLLTGDGVDTSVCEEVLINYKR